MRLLFSDASSLLLSASRSTLDLVIRLYMPWLRFRLMLQIAFRFQVLLTASIARSFSEKSGIGGGEADPVPVIGVK